MLLINFVITGSNTEHCMDEEQTLFPYVPLMEYLGNDQLNKFLTAHNINQSLRKRDLHTPFLKGDLFYSPNNGIIVLSVGVEPNMSSSELSDLCDTISSGTKSDDVYISEEMHEVPGASAVIEKLIKSKHIKEFSWLEIKQLLVSKPNSKTEQDVRKDVLVWY